MVEKSTIFGNMTIDEFWDVALRYDVERLSPEDCDGGDDDHDKCDYNDSDHDGGAVVNQLSRRYTIPTFGDTHGNPLILNLASLPLTDGIWSPLGAQAWYGSALLSALLLRPCPSSPDAVGTDRTNFLLEERLHLLKTTLNENCTVLELGSGAVGLSGITAGWVSSHNKGGVDDQTEICATSITRRHIILTDNEPRILRQLERNDKTSLNTLTQLYPNKTLPHMSVAKLDWNDDAAIVDQLVPAGSKLKLVIGSELVYTDESATACANLVLTLLQKYPNLLILIVQVSDRDGWETVFLPTVRAQKGIHVMVEPLVDSDVHLIASKMVPQGGTLDSRFDFCACYIRSQDGSDW